MTTLVRDDKSKVVFLEDTKNKIQYITTSDRLAGGVPTDPVEIINQVNKEYSYPYILRTEGSDKWWVVKIDDNKVTSNTAYPALSETQAWTQRLTLTYT